MTSKPPPADDPVDTVDPDGNSELDGTTEPEELAGPDELAPTGDAAEPKELTGPDELAPTGDTAEPEELAGPDELAPTGDAAESEELAGPDGPIDPEERDPPGELEDEDGFAAGPGKTEREASPLQRLQVFWDGLPGLKELEDHLAGTLQITKPRDRFMFDTAFNFILVMAVVLPLDLLFQYLTQEPTSLRPFQYFLAWAVKGTLTVFGVHTLNIYDSSEGSPVVSVPDITDWEITAQCTGLHETLFLGLLVLMFRGVRPRVRVKWALLFAILIFFENLARILVGYPLERTYGFDAWDKFHFYWWHYGQYLFIMTLFIIWVNTVAYKDLLAQKKQRQRQEQGPQVAVDG